MTDLRNHVLAENISEEFDPQTKSWIVEFDFPCPNCGARHREKEITLHGQRVNYVEYELRCGRARVQMPWVAGVTYLNRAEGVAQ